MNNRTYYTALLAAFALTAQGMAQDPAVIVQRPTSFIAVRPYQAATVPPPQLKNSGRLSGLIRDGKLYLTVQDAVALAIENNLDLEVNRYGPVLADWALERAQAGGLLRGVNTGSSLVGQVASGQGVSGSIASAGLSGGGNGTQSGSGGAVVSQIGPVTANLDPVLQNSTLFSHTTYPQSNTVVSQTTSLVDTSHIYSTSVQQGLLSGGYVTLTARDSYLKENAITDVLNPSVAPRLYLYLQHNLLSGFGPKVNSRFIRVAERNIGASRETFRSQLLDLVANVLNLYWDLAASRAGLAAKQSAQEVAQKFYEDTHFEINLGMAAKVDIYRAEGELAMRKQDYTISVAAVKQQESLLKNVLSRDGIADPALDAAEVVTLDKIQVPDKDDIQPLRDLVAIALRKRPDLSITNTRLETSELSALGTANGLLPQLTGIAQIYNSGLAGTPQVLDGVGPNPYFVGGLGTGVAQVLRRNFSNERAGAYFQIPFGNRLNQADYGVEQLQLRQAQVSSRRDQNQLVVDISNQMVALRQARARYSAAVNTRALQEQILEKEHQKFGLGISTFNEIIVAQRGLAAAQTNEVGALGAYAHARVGLDQILGETLEKNNISLSDALQGRASAPSATTQR